MVPQLFCGFGGMNILRREKREAHAILHMPYEHPLNFVDSPHRLRIERLRLCIASFHDRNCVGAEIVFVTGA